MVVDLVWFLLFFFSPDHHKTFSWRRLDLMMLVLRAWMEELDVWDLARHAALHLLPAAAVRVNKAS